MVWTAAIGRRHWPICWYCLDRGPGSFDVEDATTLSWSSAAGSEWVNTELWPWHRNGTTWTTGCVQIIKYKWSYKRRWSTTVSMLLDLFLGLFPLIFVFVPCGGLSWLYTSAFYCTLSTQYRILTVRMFISYCIQCAPYCCQLLTLHKLRYGIFPV